MNYNFTEREELGRTVFLLSLDKQNMTERIIIGKKSKIRCYFQEGIGEVYYDQSSPIGTFLQNFKANLAWQIKTTSLLDSYERSVLLENDRIYYAKPSIDFLQDQYKSNEPAAIFVSIRTWEEYLKCADLIRGNALFKNISNTLHQPFLIDISFGDILEKKHSQFLFEQITEQELTAELWYLKNSSECILVYNSLLPIFLYYINEIKDQSFTFNNCKACTKSFLSKNLHIELCSDECRKNQAAQQKIEFKERTKDDKITIAYDAAYYYWYNRVRKLKNSKNINPNKLIHARTAFESFRKEAAAMKKSINPDDEGTEKFCVWVIAQNQIIDQIMEAD